MFKITDERFTKDEKMQLEKIVEELGVDNLIALYATKERSKFGNFTLIIKVKEVVLICYLQV